ncbi:SH3 domain-containing protein [Jannaschia sp. M317]|uniref:SH3 domain-containing protein n=1 Tax=Jannaschia sp. M317 TaxID=2867011 RepID=UPI0021A8B121|nr:SH3 domain-containing protein [Jannaschia sp. M317]UWQ18544.1 aspartyl-trna synthetase [Jannaschia sp. M317]
MRIMLILATLVAGLFLGGIAAAQDRGPVTNLPLPRYVSMKAAEGYARRGPSSTHRIDWVFKRRHMPLRIVAEYGHWRRVQDREGAGGWMHYSLLSGNRTVLIEGSEVVLRRRPNDEAPPSARLEPGVVAWLGSCNGEWCKLEVEDAEGWAQTAHLWGVTPGEVRE